MASNDLKRFCANYKRLDEDGSYSWSALDRALTDVCTTMPLHTAVDEVYAKIRLINRAYLANMQFGAKDAEWKVAKKFVKGNADAIFAPLRSSLPFSLAGLTNLLDAHEGLVKPVLQVTGKVHNSFVSKYLHFHFPEAVPVFDSYAYNAAWKLAQPPESEFPQYDRRVNRDYGYYCGAILQIIHLLGENGVKSPRLKLLDVLLYGRDG